jgi:hypothetical protein
MVLAPTRLAMKLKVRIDGAVPSRDGIDARLRPPGRLGGPACLLSLTAFESRLAPVSRDGQSARQDISNTAAATRSEAIAKLWILLRCLSVTWFIPARA